MNDETFGEEAEDEVTFGAQPPPSGSFGSHAIAALAEAFEDEQRPVSRTTSGESAGSAGVSVEAAASAAGAAATTVVAAVARGGATELPATDDAVDPHALLGAWADQGAALLAMLSAHPTNASAARAAAKVALAAVNALVEELPALKHAEVPRE